MKDYEHSLDYIDHFIRAGRDLAGLEVLRLPQLQQAASALCDVSVILLQSNGYMADWLGRFQYFDFKSPDARGKFFDLLREYDSTQASTGFHRMKFPCGDIATIYERDILPELAGLPQADQAVAADVESAFMELSGADVDMVAYINNRVLSSIDAFRDEAEASFQGGDDLNAAETARLKFSRESRDLSVRLARFAGDLSDLALGFAQLAGRPVVLDSPPLT